MARGGYREGSGRKKGEATLIAERTRARIAQEVEKALPEILGKAVEQAKDGQKDARDFLFDRGFGKATQFHMTRDDEGKERPVPILDLYVRTDNSDKQDNSTTEKD